MASPLRDSASPVPSTGAGPPRPTFTQSRFSRALAYWEERAWRQRSFGPTGSSPRVGHRHEPASGLERDDENEGQRESSWPDRSDWTWPAMPGSGIRRWRRNVMAALVVTALVGVGWWLVAPAPAPIESVLPAAGASGASDRTSGGRSATATATATVTGATASGSESEAEAETERGVDPDPSVVPAVVVQAAGAVNAPGVHRLPVGSRVDDLVRAAGGVTPEADLDRVNLAALLADGERIWIPRRGEVEVPSVVSGGSGGSGAGSGGGAGVGGGSPGSSATAALAGPLDLNTATAEQLDALPGVGPATAAAILAHRDANGPFQSVEDLLDVRGIGDAKLEQIRPLVTV